MLSYTGLERDNKGTRSTRIPSDYDTTKNTSWIIASQKYTNTISAHVSEKITLRWNRSINVVEVTSFVSNEIFFRKRCWIQFTLGKTPL